VRQEGIEVDPPRMRREGAEEESRAAGLLLCLI
jgi:hypothetical protein